MNANTSSQNLVRARAVSAFQALARLCILLAACQLPVALAQTDENATSNAPTTDTTAQPQPRTQLEQATVSSDGTTQTYTREITIENGDTLSHIALRELGSQHLAEKIATYNGLSLTQVLKPGTTILVPFTLPVRDEYATVIFTKGDVQLNGVRANPEDEVRLNDVLETGGSGFASLSFETGTLINLQPNTLAKIVTLHCLPDDDKCVIEMSAERGTLTTDVKRNGNQPTDFRVQTPYASAAVRGTVFDINADESGLRIGVTEGTVDLEAIDTDQKVAVETGFGTVAKPGLRISEPVELLPAPVFRFVPPRIAKGDYLRWFGLTDTNEYQVQVATSSDGSGVVLNRSVPSDSFTLDDDVNAGDYSVLVRAVDPNGLLGFVSSSPLTIATLDESIRPVNATVDLIDNNYQITIVDPTDLAEGYEIQVAADFNFSDPVSVDINETGVALVRLDGERLFARARVLVDRTTVGPFGEASTVNR